MQLEKIPVAYRPPFSLDDLYVSERRAGESILEMVRSIPNLPPNFMRVGYVCINGEIVPQELWARVRPKPPRNGLHVAVTFHIALHGGGDTGGRSTTKSIIGIVAAIALIVVTQGIASGALFGTLGEIGFGITGAQVLAGAVGIAGALAISALTAPPTTSGLSDIGSDNANQAEAAGAQANILDKGGAVPRVIGTRKVFPPFACEPLVELVEQDEYVEALFVLNGPHLIEDIRIENNPVAAAQDVQIETREGWPGDTAVTLITRQGKTTTPQIELSTHTLASNGESLLHPATPTDDLPVFHGFASRNQPDEIWIHLLFPGGINTSGSTNPFRVPFRFRFRKKGQTTWINAPEFHVSGASVNQFRGAIVIKFNSIWPAPPQPPTSGFDYVHVAPPPQTSFGVTTPVAWVAASQFYTGSGNQYWYSGLGSTGVQHVTLYNNRIEIHVHPTDYPPGTFGPGIYEMELMRGHAVQDVSFAKTTYGYAFGVTGIHDFFYYMIIHGVPGIDIFHNNISDRCVVVRVISMWNEPPLTTPGNFALIAIKALNRSIRQLSCVASGYVKDWDGAGWNTYVTTSNPVPHYADVLSGALNLDPLPSDLRGDTDLLAWHSLCRQNGWTCDAIINDMRAQDVLELLASCGYARPYQSDLYKVSIDADHSAEVPVQVFSRRNCANLRWERSFARVPAGFNVTYRDEEIDDDQAQVAVMQRDPANSDITLLEAISYDGLTSEDKVKDRAQFDLDQANLRSTFYYLQVDIESIVCRRGSLVAVEHDILQSRAGDGYIVSKQTSGGNITGVTLDAEIPITAGVTGIVIRRTDGTLSTHALSNASGSSAVLTFTTPITDTATIQGFVDNDRRYGCLAVAGDLTTIYRRLLVQSIAPQANLAAQMVLVDEAPTLVRYPSIKTVLLLHMEGVNGGTTFSDSTGRHVVQALGSAVTDTSTPKFGSSSLLQNGTNGSGLVMDNSGDWLLADKNFTIDFWLNTTNAALQQVFWSQGPDNTDFTMLSMTNAGAVRFEETTFNFQTANGVITAGSYIHVALERYGDLWTLFTGGVVRVQTTNGHTVSRKVGNAVVGSFVDFTLAVNGRIDEFRFSRVARYQGAGFTPPVAAYTVD